MDAGSTNRPYPPTSNLAGLLHRLRDRNPPTRIDNEYLRDIGISEGIISRLLFALRFLNLIDGDSSPTATLRSIATSTDEEYREILVSVLKEAYSEVFERVDPTQDTQDRILNVFRRYTPASQRERMVMFFLGMCREAGMEVIDAPRQRSSAATRRTGAAKPGKKTAPTQRRVTPKNGSTEHRDETQDTVGISPALLLLIRALPPEGSPLPVPKRERWLRMAEATLTFMYPEQVEEAGNGSDSKEGEQ